MLHLNIWITLLYIHNMKVKTKIRIISTIEIVTSIYKTILNQFQWIILNSRLQNRKLSSLNEQPPNNIYSQRYIDTNIMRHLRRFCNLLEIDEVLYNKSYLMIEPINALQVWHQIFKVFSMILMGNFYPVKS